jgi:uncharacterized SAM-binding protein YcdF (DUF218 family)
VFFIVSKVLSFFAEVSNLLLVLAVSGAVLVATRFRRAGVRMMIGAVAALAICGFSPLGHALILPLEERFPAWNGGQGAPDGIVILGGAIDELVSAARSQTSLTEAAERMTVAVELARQYQNARLVFSGGSGRLIGQEVAEAVIAAQFFARLGVSSDRIALEDRSRNTAENAAFSKQVADPKPGERWLLVTSASHMPRAMGCFRKVSFAVEAYPVDFRTRGTEDLMRPFDRASDGLRRTDVAVREWIGLLLYWLTGRTSELLPAPNG